MKISGTTEKYFLPTNIFTKVKFRGLTLKYTFRFIFLRHIGATQSKKITNKKNIFLDYIIFWSRQKK